MDCINILQNIFNDNCLQAEYVGLIALRIKFIFIKFNFKNVVGLL